MIEVNGRRAIVTGGGRGIGRGIVLALAEAGADVVIADIDLENAERAAAEVKSAGREALAVRIDVTDPGSVEAGVRRALEHFGEIDILVNNAGVVQDNPGAAVTEHDFDFCYQVNVKGIWNMTGALIPHFRERAQGKIVNIASIAGRKGNAFLTPYAASKAAAISLTQSHAAALGAHNINVNAVCPGLLWTPMWQKLEGMARGSDAKDVVDQRAVFDGFLESNCPLRRGQTPEDIGHAVVFLASEAARNITGQALNVDGGIEMN
jgi:NAD(P)-dependent dehydrogenase (short-subunit alcohol dehydrogenase family)